MNCLPTNQPDHPPATYDEYKAFVGWPKTHKFTRNRQELVPWQRIIRETHLLELKLKRCTIGWMPVDQPGTEGQTETLRPPSVRTTTLCVVTAEAPQHWPIERLPIQLCYSSSFVTLSPLLCSVFVQQGILVWRQ